MKNIFANKKLLTIVVLLLLVFFFSSCSATSYWWGTDSEGRDFDNDNPFEACLAAILAPIFSLFPNESNLVIIVVGIFWLFGLSSALIYMGSNPNYSGKSYRITIGGKEHIIEDNCDLNKNRWDNKVIIYLLFLIVFIFLYNLITGWFDDLNLFFKLIIGCISAIITKGLCSLVLPFVETFKLISWYFISIDYVLGIIVTLWIY